MSNDTCRICIQICKTKSMKNIFNSNVVDDIEKLIGLKLAKSELLPDKICPKCFLKLETAMSFYQMCIKSVQHFHVLSKTINLKQTIKIDGDFSELTNNECDNVKLDNNISNIAIMEHTFDDSNVVDGKIEKKKSAASLIKDLYKNIKPQLICDVCGNIFERKQHFLLHVKRHKDEKTFECEICGKKFFTNSELNRHMRCHTGEKPFECKFCQRKFSDCSTHIKHERTHTNERPFMCKQCGKSFTCSYILKNHILIHTGERAYKCTFCNKSFQRDQHLRTHFKSITHQQNAANKRK